MRHDGAVRLPAILALACALPGCFGGAGSGTTAGVPIDETSALLDSTLDPLEVGPPSDAPLFEIEPPDGDAEIDAAFDAPYEVALDAGGDADPLLPGCGAASFKGRSYVFCERDAKWDEARTACKFMGRDLAILDDADKVTFVRTVIAPKSAGDWHIGLNDRAKEGEWLWVDGKKLGWSAWHKDEPNNGWWPWANEDCVVTYQDGTWNDIDCGDTMGGFICEGK